jgi:hypothetical protein
MTLTLDTRDYERAGEPLESGVLVIARDSSNVHTGAQLHRVVGFRTETHITVMFTTTRRTYPTDELGAGENYVAMCEWVESNGTWTLVLDSDRDDSMSLADVVSNYFRDLENRTSAR